MHFSQNSKITTFSALLLTLFSATVLADSTSDLPNLSSVAASVSSAAVVSTSSSAATTTDASTKAATSGVTTDASIDGSTGALATISATGTVETTNTDSVPTISSSAALPTLTAIQSGADLVNTYPAPSVPPTSNAPFMQQSSLPSGTVFIVVGAILAFLTFAVLAWRSFLAWSLDRAVKKAASQNNMADAKLHFRTPALPIYKYKDGKSQISLGPIRKGKKDNRPPTSNEDPSRQSLFFSPTAGPGASIQNNRGSAYLPSGYYAAGSSANGSGMVGNGGSSPGISLSNLSSHAQGYQRARSVAPSPPDSPSYQTRRPQAGGPHYSTSTLDLPAQERVPSIYLDELFDQESGSPPGGPPHRRQYH